MIISVRRKSNQKNIFIFKTLCTCIEYCSWSYLVELENTYTNSSFLKKVLCHRPNGYNICIDFKNIPITYSVDCRVQ